MHINEVKINTMNAPHCQRPWVSFLIFVWLLFSVCLWGEAEGGSVFPAPTSEG